MVDIVSSIRYTKITSKFSSIIKANSRAFAQIDINNCQNRVVNDVYHTFICACNGINFIRSVANCFIFVFCSVTKISLDFNFYDTNYILYISLWGSAEKHGTRIN